MLLYLLLQYKQAVALFHLLDKLIAEFTASVIAGAAMIQHKCFVENFLAVACDADTGGYCPGVVAENLKLIGGIHSNLNNTAKVLGIVGHVLGAGDFFNLRQGIIKYGCRFC